jgi:hypothetical protein
MCLCETVSFTQLLKGQSQDEEMCSAGRLKLGKETLATIDGHWDDRVMWKVRRPMLIFFPFKKQIFS